MEFGLKQRQRRDMRMQRHDVPESEAAVATLRLNVATFQRRVKMMSRCWDPTYRHSRGG